MRSSPGTSTPTITTRNLGRNLKLGCSVNLIWQDLTLWVVCQTKPRPPRHALLHQQGQYHRLRERAQGLLDGQPRAGTKLQLRAPPVPRRPRPTNLPPL